MPSQASGLVHLSTKLSLDHPQTTPYIFWGSISIMPVHFEIKVLMSLLSFNNKMLSHETVMGRLALKFHHVHYTLILCAESAISHEIFYVFSRTFKLDKEWSRFPLWVFLTQLKGWRLTSFSQHWLSGNIYSTGKIL